jgi:alcohol dehydrogenase
MQCFDFIQRTRFVFGAGAVDRLGSLAKELNGTRVLVVSDPGVVKAGHFDHGRKRLEEAGLQIQSFHGLHENPSTKEVEAGTKMARAFKPDLLVGLGGGSSMDCAKGINFLYSCGGEMKDYWGVGKATSPLLPMIAVPTTSGTGSEAQSFALISDAETHVKMACGDPKAACKVAILDPELTVTQPPRITALTGIDALTHALETFVTNKRTDVSRAFSRQAWQLLSHGLQKVIDNPSDIDARGKMQLGACMAGMAIEASMLGAAHALANPLTAKYSIPHGQAVGMMMPHVVRFNAQLPEIESAYKQLVSAVGGSDEKAGDTIAHWFTKQLQIAGLKTSLSDLKIYDASIVDLAEEAAKQWTASFNPREVSVADFQRMYDQAQ